MDTPKTIQIGKTVLTVIKKSSVFAGLANYYDCINQNGTKFTVWDKFGNWSVIAYRRGQISLKFFQYKHTNKFTLND